MHLNMRRMLTLNSGKAAFAPDQIGGLAIWMCADDISGNDGDAVASWVSREGNTYNFAQATGTKQPALKKAANGINGCNVVRFDAGDILVLPSAPLVSQTGTVIGVFKLSATPTDLQYLLSSTDEAGAAVKMVATAVYYNSSIKNLFVYQRNNDTTDVIYGNTVLTAGTVYVGVWNCDGAYALRLNGTQQTLSINGSGANTGDWFADTADRDNTAIGGWKGSSESGYFKGDIAEILVYSTALTLPQQQQVETYLKARYGLNFP